MAPHALPSTYMRAIVGKALYSVDGGGGVADADEQERGEEKTVDHVVSNR